MKTEIIETDVLCVGGGIAGLMAAIRASERGAKVTVVEKGNVLASGAGRAGNDHFHCYLPEVHGPDIKPSVQKLQSHRGQIRDRKVAQAWAERSSEIVKLWDHWGIPMKYEGRYEFAGHGYPGEKLTFLKYSGQRQKTVLTEQAQARKVNVINRVMVMDLLQDGGTVGAIGIGTREDTFYVFKAKSVFLGTGFVTRLFPAPVLGRVGNPNFPPTVTGDGRAMAFRAGASLVGLDMPYSHCGPKYFLRSGQGTWVGVVRDALGHPVGPFVTQPDRRYGDPALERYPMLFEDYLKTGRGPVYMDCRGISDEDYNYFIYFMKHEGLESFLNYLDEEGIDLRKNPVEFMRYEIRLNGGIYYNEKSETSVAGLYTAGDELFGGIANAAIFGWIAGENAAEFASQRELPELDRLKGFIDEKKEYVNEIRRRETGTDWKDANMALQQTMNDYAGTLRSETMLEAGLAHLRRLRSKAQAMLTCRNQWELVRCLEVLNLFDLGELVFIAARERKETRGRHMRPDYPVTDPRLDRSRLFVKKDADKVATEWREIGN